MCQITAYLWEFRTSGKNLIKIVDSLKKFFFKNWKTKDSKMTQKQKFKKIFEYLSNIQTNMSSNKQVQDKSIKK